MEPETTLLLPMWRWYRFICTAIFLFLQSTSSVSQFMCVCAIECRVFPSTVYASGHRIYSIVLLWWNCKVSVEHCMLFEESCNSVHNHSLYSARPIVEIYIYTCRLLVGLLVLHLVSETCAVSYYYCYYYCCCCCCCLWITFYFLSFPSIGKRFANRNRIRCECVRGWTQWNTLDIWRK